MKKINKTAKFMLVLLFLLTFNIRQVNAEETLAISANAILPDNQHNKNVTYFDLRMKPNQTQELEYELSNTTDKDQKVKIELNNATTNDVGVINYSVPTNDYKQDDSLKIGLTDIAEAPKEVTVKAKTKEIVKIKLSMPSTKFDGIISGAVKISSIEPEKEKKEKSSGMSIKNEIIYTTSIVLSETDKDMYAELQLKKVFASQTGGRNVVKANIQNKQPQILNDITYSAEVFKKDGKEPLHRGHAEKYRMAPNSNFNFNISWESQPFKSGDYRIHMTAESKETGQKWEWDKEFEITTVEAKKLNEKAIDLDKNNTIFIIIIGSVIIIVIVLAYIILRKIKKNKEEKRRRELKKKKKNRKKQNGSKKVKHNKKHKKDIKQEKM
ncbi:MULTISPECIES: DUF916 and DUF3324 domain-containing protein [Vagococcus]|uniref:Cell surface protein n=1 Tax=Vagococcus fluvialis bH819 TaxID=1255619 RepID=A0A1X6WLX7_9ENTE|nr:MULTISPECIES: DUF916 and DUF3324 domain-containing protein [Vagococcus]SLM85343.1 cell surface protein precursor [Vagococcus fluvialis bH819]HCM89363.1 DUF916 and DUF3324 domain-containing protein [Vagococcus sp.]